ncbi:H/ACA ribonucleoprotein complex subunit GAR1-like [Penaeus japonicus]|uniref:H/ACA ribonucleoprotein complex subunit GAR1-like n=1 Tax=Penaeus japonicus TaxID=27405 RepID=UPI001C70E187|nr:H/ACA ribonucleoprotein complex subunit GAR1-like [Penaeus japonicus]
MTSYESGKESFAQPQGYGLPTASENGLFSGAGGFSSGAETLGGNGFSSGVAGLASAHESSRAGAGYDGGSGGPSGACREGEIIHDGICVVPVITRNVYVFDAPERPQQPAGPPPSVPPPKIDHNIVSLFVFRKQDQGLNPPSFLRRAKEKYRVAERDLRKREQGGFSRKISERNGGGGFGGDGGYGSNGGSGFGGNGGFGGSGTGGFGDGGIGSSGVSGFGGDGGFGGSGLIDLRRGNGGIDLSGAGGNGATHYVISYSQYDSDDAEPDPEP